MKATQKSQKSQATTGNSKPIIAMTFDGGGIKGQYQLAICKELERKLPHPLVHYVDIIGGISVGGIGGGCLATGKMTCNQILDIFSKDGQKIFKKRWWKLLPLFAPKYDSKHLKSVLLDRLGDIKLKDLPVDFLTVSVDIDGEAEYTVWKSYKKEHEDMFLRDVMAKTASAPTYFDLDTSAGRTDMDGGMAENNPTMAVFCEMEKRDRNAEKIIISIGTGLRPKRLPRKARKWGILGWVLNLIDILLQQSSAMTHYYMTTLASSEKANIKYFRLNGRLNKASSSIDDASSQNLQNLQSDAMEYCLSKDVQEQLDEIVSTLTKIRP